jgi:hypothetical protein
LRGTSTFKNRVFVDAVGVGIGTFHIRLSGQEEHLENLRRFGGAKEAAGQ